MAKDKKHNKEKILFTKNYLIIYLYIFIKLNDKCKQTNIKLCNKSMQISLQMLIS
jgi:hypothetical protein